MNLSSLSAEVLVVEDDPKIAQVVLDYLRSEGHSAQTANDGLAAMALIRERMPDLLILDVMLPGMDGVAICQEVRRLSEVPIVMLTARVEEVDRLLGLDSGADDYVTKPFSPRELMARVRNLLRRYKGQGGFSHQMWQVDEAGLRVAWRRTWLDLTPVEYRIFSRLLAQPGRVFSRPQLIDGIHTDQRDISDRTIDIHNKNLRKKIQSLEPEAECIASVYGVGYRCDAPSH
jgi:two-component system response regulator BaeR